VGYQNSNLRIMKGKLSLLLFFNLQMT